MADYYTHFSIAVPLLGVGAPSKVADVLGKRRKEREQLFDAHQDDAAYDIEVDFESVIEGNTLYLSDDGMSGNVEHVARFLQELIRLGYVQDPVSFQWADTCSRPRADAFTGGGVVVTKRKLHWFVVPDLIADKLEAIARRQRARP